MEITFLGHSCLSLKVNQYHILVDPFISPNPKAQHIDLDSIKADFILLTHAHYDHVMNFEAIAKRTGALLISNHEIVTYYEKLGIKGHAMNPGGSWTFDFGLLKMVHAAHSSSFPDGTYGGNPVGFVIRSKEGKTIYISGDTALTMDMKLIPMFFNLDMAVLPIGGNFTMDIPEAVIAADFIQCNKILGVHYDTAETIMIDHDEAKQVFAKQNKQLFLLDIGEKIDL